MPYISKAKLEHVKLTAKRDHVRMLANRTQLIMSGRMTQSDVEAWLTSEADLLDHFIKMLERKAHI